MGESFGDVVKSMSNIQCERIIGILSVIGF